MSCRLLPIFTAGLHMHVSNLCSPVQKSIGIILISICYALLPLIILFCIGFILCLSKQYETILDRDISLEGLA